MKKLTLWMGTLLCAVILLTVGKVEVAAAAGIGEVSVSDVSVLGENGSLNVDHIGLPAGASYHVAQVDWFQVKNGQIAGEATKANPGDRLFVMIMLESQDKEAFGGEEHVLSSCLLEGKSLSKLTREQIRVIEEEGSCRDGYYYNMGEETQDNIISLCMTVTMKEVEKTDPVEPLVPEPEPKSEPEPVPAKPVLLLKAADHGSKAIKLSWNRIPDAKSYIIYGSACGGKCRKLVTTGTCSRVIRKIGSKKMKAHKVYKFHVVAKKDKKTLAASETAHLITAKTKGKYANAISIKAKKKTIRLAVGKTTKVSATVKIFKGKKHLGKDHGAKLRYHSSDTRIVSVDRKGVVKAKKKGRANIYIQDTSGIYCTVACAVE